MEFDPNQVNEQSLTENANKRTKKVKVYSDGTREEVVHESENLELDESMLYGAEQGEHHHHHHHHKKKSRKGWAIICIVLAIIVAIVGTVAGVLNSYYNKMNYEDLNDDYSDYLADKTPVNEDDADVTNILLIGSDNRAGLAGSRSDSMIILSVNPNTKKIIMTSILRDCYLEIPGHGKTRINAAWDYGGADLLIATIQYNFGIKLDKYVQVDFESFKDVIDELDGVDVELTSEEISYYGWNMSAGVNTLDGEKALTHARNRHIGTDFERTRRQRDIIDALISKAKTQSTTELISLADTILPEVTTNLTRGELVSLMSKAASYSSYTTEEYSLPMSGTYKDITVSGMEVLDIDCNANSKVWYEAVYD